MKTPITPGEILLEEEYLNPMGISQIAMARALARKRKQLVSDIQPATSLVSCPPLLAYLPPRFLGGILSRRSVRSRMAVHPSPPFRFSAFRISAFSQHPCPPHEC